MRTIGRTEDNDIVIDDPSVSRRHARLHLGQELMIEDVGSVNGVRLAGESLAEERTEDVQRQRIEPNKPHRIEVNMAFHVGSVAAVVRPVDAAPVARAPEVVVVDPAMRKLFDLVTRAAPGTLSILLVGETGVGKEVVTEAIHAASDRARGPLVRINCAALAESLLESELFGFDRGSFTGAQKEKIGLIESADGGTLLLDEVGELSAALQAKLLRVLEDKKVQRVGAVRPKDVDVRFVAATNRDLEEEVKRGRFRQDLYFRLAGITLAIPPLRERRSEIPKLAEQFLERAAAERGSETPSLSAEARDALIAHPWPGNVRELRNVMARAVVVSDGRTIRKDDLGLAPAARSETSEDEEGDDGSLQSDIAALEKKRIVEALDKCAGNQTRAAALLGMSRRTLLTRLRDYGIKRPRS